MPSAKGPNNSCWTCRLRHKKCDERLPSCTTCERLGIFCYGSDEKPEFMDAGEKQKQKSIEISVLVKAKNDSLRRFRALEAKRRPQCQTQETVKSSQNTMPASNPASNPMLFEAETLQESTNTRFVPSVVSSLPSMPSSLKNLAGHAGCESWVQSIVEEIHTLGIQKDQLSSQPGEENSLHSKADHLWNLLEVALQSLYQRDAKLAEATPNSTNNPESHPQRMDLWVTSLFARAALIYLLITLYGTDARELSATRKLVFEWIFNFRFLPDQRLLPILTWPLCITGCVANALVPQKFFRDTIASSGIDQQSPCMIWHALDIMERCWGKSAGHGMELGSSEWTQALDSLRDRIMFKIDSTSQDF